MARQEFWEQLIEALRKNEAVALLLVVASRGSSPGRAGAKMLLPDGRAQGTIGGGSVEYAMSKKARAWLNSGQGVRLYRLQHRQSTDGQASGQLCGGSQSVVYLRCTRQHVPLLQQLLLTGRQEQSSLLQIAPRGMSVVLSEKPLPGPEFSYRDDADWRYRESLNVCKTVYLFGGGHVSLALSQILTLLYYQVLVIDPRGNLETLQRNRWAAQKLCLPCSAAREVIRQGGQSSVVVMTHSHKTDQELIARLAGIDVAYFGVLGSRRKLRILRENLEGQVDEDFWDSLHAPAGLPIGSSAPMEIAVSIAVELIQTFSAAR